MRCYKGFDKDLKCSGFQYEIGETYETDKADLCHEGFHACENPLDVLRHNSPVDSRFCEVDLDANEQKGKDSKRVGKKIQVGAEIGLDGLIRAGIEFAFEKAEFEDSNAGNAASSGTRSTAVSSGVAGNAASSGTRSTAVSSGDAGNAVSSGYGGNAVSSGRWGNAVSSGYGGNAVSSGRRGTAVSSGRRGTAVSSGDEGNAVSSGYGGNAVSSGDAGTAVSSGDEGNAVSSGDDSVAIVTGRHSKAKGVLGCWLVLTERDSAYHIVDMKAVKVDGEKIKPDTFYALKDGKVVEV